MKTTKKTEKVVAVQASDLFLEHGLYYLWARGHRRPCIMPCGQCGPDGILMFTTATAARRYLEALAECNQSMSVAAWPIKFVHVTNLPWFFKKWRKFRKVIIPRLSDCAHQVFDAGDLVEMSRFVSAAIEQIAA